MTTWTLSRTHGQMTPGVECHHHHWQHIKKDDIEREMPYSPMDCTDGGTTSGVACHHLPFTQYTVVLHLAWHAMMAQGVRTWSDDIGRGKPSSPMDYIHRVERRQA